MIAMSEANTGFLDKLRVWALGVARDRGIEIDSSEEAQVIIENVLREFRGAPWAPFDSAEAKEGAINQGRRGLYNYDWQGYGRRRFRSKK